MSQASEEKIPDDGGPAFPQMWEADSGDNPTGMSLRDYFAGKALATMKIPDWSDNPLYWEGVAKSAYVCADAILKERAK